MLFALLLLRHRAPGLAARSPPPNSRQCTHIPLPLRPLQLPASFFAFRKQQHRWTCGPIQLWSKASTDIWRSQVGWWRGRWEAGCPPGRRGCLPSVRAHPAFRTGASRPGYAYVCVPLQQHLLEPCARCDPPCFVPSCSCRWDVSWSSSSSTLACASAPPTSCPLASSASWCPSPSSLPRQGAAATAALPKAATPSPPGAACRRACHEPAPTYPRVCLCATPQVSIPTWALVHMPVAVTLSTACFTRRGWLYSVLYVLFENAMGTVKLWAVITGEGEVRGGGQGCFGGW